jgi:hypothetical protein
MPLNISRLKSQNISSYFKGSGKAKANLSTEPLGKEIFATRAF